MPRTIVLLLAFFLAVVPTFPQFGSSFDKVVISPLAVSGRSGDTATVVIKARFAKDWHAYGLTKVVGPDGLGPEATEITVLTPAVFRSAGRAKVTKGLRVHFDSTWGTKVEEVGGNAEIAVPVLLRKDLPVGTTKGKIRIGLQTCNTECFPFDEKEFDVTVTITGVGDGTIVEETPAQSDTPSTKTIAGPSAITPTSGEADEVQVEKEKGLWSFFFYAMGVGFLALLTPCVFPMIPITVSFFTKRHEKRRGRGVQESLLFGVGIISTFTAVGILASAIFGGTAVQDLAANPWLNLGIGILFVVLAFNLFGAFEIQVPVSIMNALNKKSQGDGNVAILLMGLTFSLTSFTCTVPFVGTLLLSASGGDYLYPAVGTLGFATAFALPFVGLSLFPSLLVRLPRAGGWMNNLKVVMGFLEIAAAIKFFSTAEFIFGLGLLPREVFLSVWAGVCFLIVLYLIGSFEMKLDSSLEKVSGLRAMFAVIFATLGFWFVGGVNGKPLAADLEALLPPENYHELLDQLRNPSGTGKSAVPLEPRSSSNAGHSQLPWITDLSEAKKIAKERNMPVFIDFTGFSCVNCRKMEKTVFAKSIVEETFKKFVLVQLYTDRKSEPYITNQNILKQYGTVANPLYVLLRPDGTYIAKTGYKIEYSNNPQLFVDFLSKAL